MSEVRVFWISKRIATLASVVMGMLLVPPRGAAEPVPEGKAIIEVIPDLNAIRKWHDSNGDTGDPFWADDDSLYTFMCDGRGFGKEVMNLNFNRLGAGDWLSLAGNSVNPMAEYGKGNQKEADGATWKVCGQECIDGVFYGFVARNVYGKDNKGDPLMRQSSFNASLIKSTDRGLTWTRSAAENLASPMWPGTRFGAPGFIHYGKNGGSVTQDGADRFVYAISNNGFWNGGDNFILGRVARGKLPRLQASDWTYHAGGQDSWTADISKAVPILSRPAKLGWTSPCYIPALRRYLLVSWYVTPTLKKWFEPGEVIYDFHEAPHPWGPWSFVSSLSDRFIAGGHMYGPNICAKFQQAGPDGVRVALFTSGCPFDDKPAGLYKLWSIPLTLRTEARAHPRLVNNDDPSITYRGAWQLLRKPGLHYHGDDIHATQGEGDTAEISFEGTGIELVSEKFANLGMLDVRIDGRPCGTVNPAQENFPRLVRVSVFAATGLAPGKHTLHLTSRGKQWSVVDGFLIHP